MKRLPFIALIVLSIIIFSNSSTANKNNKIVLTSFYPMYIMAINIADNVPGIKIVNMTKPQTGCLHDYQLTPHDMQSLANAWVFVINGGGMESFIDKAIKQQPKLKIINASKGIQFIKNNHNHENHTEHKHNGQEEEFNPHVWVSISCAIDQVKNIRDELMKLDSANADAYRNNADTYITKLEVLKSKMHAGLSEISSRNIITFHEAFPYFAREFNLNIVAVIEREPGSEPSAGELAQTVAIVKGHKVKALFAEPQYSAKAAQTIARETGSTLYTLDPAVTGEMTRDSYLQIMNRNLGVLQKALK